MAAPLYSSSAPLFEAGGVSGSTPIAGQGGASPAAVKPSGQTINVIDPASGETYGLDAAYVPDALAKGFKVETAEHAGIRKYVAENKGLAGDAKVAFRGLLDEATFGGADPLIDANRDPYELAKWRALKADHDVANITGRVGGFGLSLLYGGEFFGAASKAGGTAAKMLGRGALDAVEHGVARGMAAEAAYRAPGLAAASAEKIGSGAAAKILQSAADMGVQGAVLSSPKAVAELITGDPERAAETWIYGAAGGAALGAVAGGVGSMFGGTASKMLPATEGAAAGGALRGAAGREAERQAFRSFASNHASLKKGAKVLEKIENGQTEAGRYAIEKDLLRGFREDVAEHADRIAKNVADEGEALGAIRKSLDDLVLTSGETNGMSVKEIAGIIKKDVINPLKSKPGYESVVAKIEAYVDSFSEKAAGGGAVGFSKDKITFSRLHEVQQSLDDIAWRNSGANPAEHVKELREVRRILHDYTLEKGEAFAQKYGQEFAEPLKAANRNYQYALALDAITSDFSKVREMTVRTFSPTDYLSGASSMLAGMVGGGIPGAVAGAAVAYGHKVLREEGNALAARALDRFAKGRGLVALEEAHATHAAQLDHIPQALAAMSAGKIAPRTPIRDTIGVNILTRFLGIDPADKLDSDKRLMALADNLASLSTDPARISERAQEAIAPIVGDAPDVGVAATTKLTGIVSYLAGVAPKAPSQASPFEPPTQWKPNAAQMAEFRTRVKVALDPYAAIDALNNGTLTKPHVETLMTVSPRLYEEMIKRVTDFASGGNAKPMPYAQRLRLSLLTGAPLDRSIAQIAGYQQAFTAPAQQKAKAPNIKPPEVSAVERLSAG